MHIDLQILIIYIINMKEIITDKLKFIFNFINKHKLWIISLFLTLIPVIFYFSLWNMLYYPLYYTDSYIPVLFSIIVFIPFILFGINRIFFKNNIVEIVSVAISIILDVLIFCLLAAYLSKLVYFSIESAPYILAIITIIAVIVFVMREKYDKKVRNILLIIVSFAIASIFVFGVFNLQPVFFDTKASVYMVEDEYQICWSTSTTTAGFVEIGGKQYYDSSAGALTCSTLHKVTIPRDILDTHKKYTITSYGVSHNRAYYPIRTSTVSREYTFRPINFDDGIQIYNISDNHLYRTGPERAASYFGDKLDILIANGDHVNDVSEDWQIKNMYRLIGNITGGSVPVILSRGNHEAGGSEVASLPQWYASRDNTFYYTVRVGNIAFIVLDIGNLDKDAYSVQKNVGDYNTYRQEEVEWLKGLYESGTLSDPSIKNRIVVCHVPFPLATKRYGGDTAKDMLDYLNLMDIDIMLAGHSHKTVFYDSNSYAYSDTEHEGLKNAANFPVILGSLRNDVNMKYETLFGYEFTGTSLEIKDGGYTLSFTNSLHEVNETHSF